MHKIGQDRRHECLPFGIGPEPGALRLLDGRVERREGSERTPTPLGLAEIARTAQLDPTGAIVVLQ